MTAIRAERLYKVFGARPERALPLLEEGRTRDEVQEQTGLVAGVVDANFEVERGEIFVIMGLSGSGKSTLVRMLNFLHPPTSGEVWVHGHRLDELAPKQLRKLRAETISMVFQSFALLPHRTIIDNAAFGLEIQGKDKQERHEQAARALGMVGLSGWEDSYPRQLSGGMRQRVGLARALATDSEILLMDEPFSALDPLIRRDMQAQLLELQSDLHKTIVFITHDLNEAMRIGDRVAVMKDGVIEQIGKPDEILNEPATDYVRAFTQDVDRSRVISTGSVMVDSVATLQPGHGPRTALHEMKRHQVDSLFVTDAHQRLLGVVFDKALAGAGDRGEERIEGVVDPDVAVVGPDQPLAEALGTSATQEFPVAVVDDDRRLLGVLSRAALLAALGADEEEFEAGEVTAQPPQQAAEASAEALGEPPEPAEVGVDELDERAADGAGADGGADEPDDGGREEEA